MEAQWLPLAKGKRKEVQGGQKDHTYLHYDDVIMSEIASQITSLTIVYSTVLSGADQSKHQSSVSLAFVWEIHRWPVNFPHKWPVTRKIFPFDDVIMVTNFCNRNHCLTCASILQPWQTHWWPVCHCLGIIHNWTATIAMCEHPVYHFWMTKPTIQPLLTHWGWHEMAAVSQTTLSNTFSWMKMFEYRLKFHWSLFLRVQ